MNLLNLMAGNFNEADQRASKVMAEITRDVRESTKMTSRIYADYASHANLSGAIDAAHETPPCASDLG